MTQFVLALSIVVIMSLVYWVGYAEVDAIIINVDVSSQSITDEAINVAANVGTHAGANLGTKQE